MKHFVFSLSMIAITSNLQAAVLNMLPSPMAQGGMIHLNVALNGFALNVDIEAGTPVLKPLSAWSPGDTFNPASPWHDRLDPTQTAAAFNSQYGLVITGESDLLPSGSRIFVDIVSATAGLDTYRWRNTEPQVFDPIMGTAGSPEEWDWNTANHGMFHPLFVMNPGGPSTASATLRFMLVDSAGDPLAGYSQTEGTVNFSIIPEPSAALLGIIGLPLMLRRRR